MLVYKSDYSVNILLQIRTLDNRQGTGNNPTLVTECNSDSSFTNVQSQNTRKITPCGYRYF